MSFQLPLDFRLQDELAFSRFITGSNSELVDRVTALARGDENGLFYVSAASGAGKTHLLQAAARLAQDAIYLPCNLLIKHPVEVLDGMESRRLVCIDDIHLVAGMPEWELALFTLINGINEAGGSFIVSAIHAPMECGFQLKDLVSRLTAGLQYQLEEPDEQSKRTFLQQDAKRRGLQINDEVADWILNHLPRDMRNLSNLLNQLDKESLRTQRRITIPFVKSCTLT
ncbi:MAG: DnaA regulatory inactivator Hda [Gammaproteobacteria bacterium]|nr:MAG: DnaA regulatory inactivator Hda [Gammaproteobacteria bacterium]